CPAGLGAGSMPLIHPDEGGQAALQLSGRAHANHQVDQRQVSAPLAATDHPASSPNQLFLLHTFVFLLSCSFSFSSSASSSSSSSPSSSSSSSSSSASSSSSSSTFSDIFTLSTHADNRPRMAPLST